MKDRIDCTGLAPFLGLSAAAVCDLRLMRDIGAHASRDLSHCARARTIATRRDERRRARDRVPGPLGSMSLAVG